MEKKNNIIIIGAAVLVVIMIFAGLMFKRSPSSKKNVQESLNTQSRSEQLVEIRENIYKNINNKKERIEYVNELVTNKMLTQEEANYLLDDRY